MTQQEITALIDRARSMNLASAAAGVNLLAEDQNCFSICHQKHEVLRTKHEVTSRGLSRIVVISSHSNYANISQVVNEIPVELVPELNLKGSIDSNGELRNLHNSIVIMTNNNVASIGIERLSKMASLLPKTIFVVHDFDNHHWFSHSLDCCIFSDIYAPAHSINHGIFGRLNPAVFFHIPCGTLQWSRQFLLEHLADMTRVRSERAPLGKHSYYPKFTFRNQVLKTVNAQYSSVGLLEGDFHSRNPNDRWDEWISYPLHFISPVFGDLPIRFFDSLITGGIPLVPTYLKPHIQSLGVPDQYYLCYSPKDILDLRPLVDYGLREFERGGIEGRIERFQFCLQNFHVDAIVFKLFDAAMNVVSATKRW